MQLLRRFLLRHLMRVLRFGDEVIDNTDKRDPTKESRDVDPMPANFPVGLTQCLDPFKEYLHEGNVKHNTSGKPCGNGQEAIIRPLGKKGQNTANTRRQTRNKGQTQG